MRDDIAETATLSDRTSSRPLKSHWSKKAHEPPIILASPLAKAVRAPSERARAKENRESLIRTPPHLFSPLTGIGSA